jgi:MFS family permease
MSALGIGEIIGGQIVGVIKDKIGTKITLFVQMVLTAAGFGMVFLINERNKYDLWVWCMCFVWGFQDSGLNCIVRSMLGFEFDSKIIPFSVFNFIQSICICEPSSLKAQLWRVMEMSPKPPSACI